MADAYYDSIRKQIKRAADGGVENVDILWAVADATAAVVDGVTGIPVAGSVNSYVQGIYGLASSRNGAMVPNPWFVWNQHDDEESQATKSYLKKRGWLGLGSAAVAIGGAVASVGTHVDVGAVVQHGNATGSTAVHLVKFRAIANSYKRSQTIAGWIDVIVKMKAIKAALRGGQLLTAAVTAVPFGGATAVSITAGILAAAAKLGIKARYSTICMMTAMDLHWRAFQEQSLLRGVKGMGKGTGPATRILMELFSLRGLTRVFGQHDVNGFIHEPAGWMAVSDKLLLM